MGFKTVMASDDRDTLFSDAQARSEELERRLKKSESARSKAENALAEKDATIERNKERYTSTVILSVQLLKDADNKYERSQEELAGLCVENQFLTNKIAKFEASAAVSHASTRSETEAAPAATSTAANPFLFADDIPQHKPVKLIRS